MYLFDAADRWTLLSSNEGASNAALSATAAEAVRIARDRHDEAKASAVRVVSVDRFDRLNAAVKRWHAYHRDVCARDRGDCSCRSLIDIWLDSEFLFELVEESVPWARLSRKEIARQVTSLAGVVRHALRTTAYQAATATPSGTTSDASVRLLITPLTSAPGAPPLTCGSQLPEGLRAA